MHEKQTPHNHTEIAETDLIVLDSPEEPSLEEENESEVRRLKIRTQNDVFRQTGQGGVVMLTPGINALGVEAIAEIKKLVQGYKDFTTENDPWGEHDLGTIDWNGAKVIWKIDYYDKLLNHGSPDASDPNLTTRVLTLMFLDEY